jgi:hypothetical protein
MVANLTAEVRQSIDNGLETATITVTSQVVATPEDSSPPPPLSPQQRRQDPFEGMGYDPATISAHYRRRPFQVIARLFAIFFPLVSFYCQLWLDQRLHRTNQQQQRAVQLRQLLTNLGPAYIKIGQALSTRPDLVPPLYLEELTRLQDQLPPSPMSWPSISLK